MGKLVLFISFFMVSLAHADLRLSLEGLDFGHLPIGEVDQEFIFLRNGGKEIINALSCDIIGDSDFDCKLTCTDLGPFKSCTLIVGFSPETSGKRSAYVYILSANHKKLKLKVQGQGYDL